MKHFSYIKVVAAALAAVLIITLFSGCSKGNKKLDFIFPFHEDIESYDPQIASTSDEYLLIENTFEGLVRINDDGTVVNGCAESYDISPDGLTYTFHIQKGLKWDITTDRYKTGTKKGEYKDARLRFLGYDFDPEITADDFVFALQRACMPATASPMFPSLAAIKNAVAVNEGKMKADALGVTAPDAYTVKIQLSAKDDAFLETMASSVAMPCNRQFFEATKGRYGLEIKYTLFNGQFYLDQILQESYLLKKNEEYKGPAPAKADELTLKIVNSEDEKDAKKSTVGRLGSGYYDAALISGQERERLGEESGITYTPYTDTTWVLMFNTGNEILQSKNIRKAFCLGLSDLTKTDKAYYAGAANFVPASCRLGNKNVSEAVGRTVPKQNTQKSMELWRKGLNVIDTTEITLTILATEDAENALKAALQGIQSGISTINKNKDGDTVEYAIRVETVSLADMETALKKRTYDIALYPYKATSTSPVAFLKAFSQRNRTGFDAKKFNAALLKAESAKGTAEALQHIKEAEQALLADYTLYPLISETSYYAAAKNVSGIQFHPGTGRVSFVSANRKE